MALGINFQQISSGYILDHQLLYTCIYTLKHIKLFYHISLDLHVSPKQYVTMISQYQCTNQNLYMPPSQFDNDTSTVPHQVYIITIFHLWNNLFRAFLFLFFLMKHLSSIIHLFLCLSLSSFVLVTFLCQMFSFRVWNHVLPWFFKDVSNSSIFYCQKHYILIFAMRLISISNIFLIQWVEI